MNDPAKPVISMNAEQVADLFATVAGAIVGGICLSVLGLQPVSATGALLQQGMIYADNTRATAFPDLSGIGVNAAQAVVMGRFFVLLCSLICGTMIGRFLVKTARFRSFAGSLIVLFYIIGIATLSYEYFLVQNFSQFGRAAIGSLFGLATGILWGCMPGDKTTAKSGLLKRTALGDGKAFFQILLFGALTAITVGTLAQLEHGQTVSIAAFVALVVGLAYSSYRAAGLFTQAWGVGSGATGNPLRPQGNVGELRLLDFSVWSGVLILLLTGFYFFAQA